MTLDGRSILCKLFGCRPNPAWNVGLRLFCPRCFTNLAFGPAQGPEMPFWMAFNRPKPEESGSLPHPRASMK
jgi:hypothetical protein